MVRAPVAVCTLADRDLARVLAQVPGVARAGTLATANLGVEELVGSVLRAPWIRYLLLCGEDPRLFQPGQTLLALAANGLDPDRRVIGAEGHRPRLPTLRPSDVDAFRRQVEIVDARGKSDAGVLTDLIASLTARVPEPLRAAPRQVDCGSGSSGFRRLRPGGRRVPIAQRTGSFFVVRLADRQIVVRQYDRDYTLRAEMCGVRAESMLLGLIGAGAVTEPDHAGYLGGELTKAETALRLGLDYVQDRPLRAPQSYSTNAPR
jgi:hypothetical protein